MRQLSVSEAAGRRVAVPEPRVRLPLVVEVREAVMAEGLAEGDVGDAGDVGDDGDEADAGDEAVVAPAARLAKA
ncbi:hypothetical protein GCM10009863_42780 [Streptomyces axinellae]|uniref:Uncharacterized protein n=1 Tax=Streptomyces axinellae TaxID=552788 RepID=A0ABP6CT51_9ACTN